MKQAAEEARDLQVLKEQLESTGLPVTTTAMEDEGALLESLQNKKTMVTGRILKGQKIAEQQADGYYHQTEQEDASLARMKAIFSPREEQV